MTIYSGESARFAARTGWRVRRLSLLFIWLALFATLTPGFEARQSDSMEEPEGVAPENEGDLPDLLIAIRDTDERTFRALLPKADVNIQSTFGWNALMMAAR